MKLKKYETRTTLILSALALLILIAGAFWWMSGYKSSNFRREPTFTGLEIAEKAALFLDKTMNANGSFNLMYECKKTSSDCNSVDTSGPVHTGQILRAYHNLWKATGNPKYKERADRAMQFVLDSCAKDTMYCEWNFFALHDFYMDSNDNRYKEAMLKSADKFLNESLENTVNNNNGIKLGALYHATQDKKYLNKLEATAKQILDGKLSRGQKFFTHDDYVMLSNDIHIIWSVYLPAYISSQNPLYLDAIKDFFARAHITEHLNKFNSDAGLGIGNLTKAWEVLLDLYEITHGRDPHHGDAHNSMNIIPVALASHDHPDIDPEIFLIQAREIGQRILNTRWDLPATKRYNADYGFLNAARTSAGDNIKTPFYNGWLIQLYLKMGDENFKVKPLNNK